MNLPPNRGQRKGILLIGDSLPPNQFTLNNIDSVLDPKHSVYNSLIIPIKFYLNNYLNSIGYCLPLEEYKTDYFYYINAVQDPQTKKNPNFSELKEELNKTEHKIILCMGEFAFGAVETVKDGEFSGKYKFAISKLGEVFRNRVNSEKITFPIIIPILHNIANLKFERTKEFIINDKNEYISYFHYVGSKLGKLLLRHKEEFNFIIPVC